MIIGISGKINSGKDTIGQIIKTILDNPHLNNEGILNFIKKEVYNNEKSPYYPSWEIRKFADKLKDIVCMLIGCTREQLEDREFKEKELGEEWWYYKDSLFTERMLPYTEHKEELDNDLTYYIIKLTPRLLLQLLGTECGRQIIHPNIWVNALMSEYKLPFNNPAYEEYLPNWIITDMRFPNELKAIKDKGGISIRVNREIKHQVEALGGRTNVPEGYFPTNQHESETALDNAEFDYVIDNNGTIEELIQKVKEILVKEKLIK